MHSFNLIRKVSIVTLRVISGRVTFVSVLLRASRFWGATKTFWIQVTSTGKSHRVLSQVIMTRWARSLTDITLQGNNMPRKHVLDNFKWTTWCVCWSNTYCPPRKSLLIPPSNSGLSKPWYNSFLLHFSQFCRCCQSRISLKKGGGGNKISPRALLKRDTSWTWSKYLKILLTGRYAADISVE